MALEYTVELPSGISSFNGMNVAWLQYETRDKVKHDGYGNAFNNYYFNGINAHNSIDAQLALMQGLKIRTIRLWLNIYHYMNSDKEAVGYTEFRPEFLKNLATYCDWCNERGIKILICLDDCWYTFPWAWVNDTEKRATYINACKDVVTALKDKPAVWGWDYCNEPYMGWAWSDVKSTTHWHNGMDNNVGYTRKTLTDFFIELYNNLKPIAQNHYFSVGSTYPPNRGSKDLRNWDIRSAVDFYQVHTYVKKPNEFNWSASEFDKTVIVGEFGFGGGGSHIGSKDFMKEMYCKFFSLGYGLIMPWSLGQCINREGVGVYSPKGAIIQTSLWQG